MLKSSTPRDKMTRRKRKEWFMPKRKRPDPKKLAEDKEALRKAVLTEYCRIAFDDIGNYVVIGRDENGETTVSYKDGDSFPTLNVSELSKNRNGFKFKLYSKESALVRLGMYLGLWKEKPEAADAEDLKTVEDLLKEDD